MSPTLVILLVGSLVAASSALVGSFLVLRKMALLGDAISHAVLPGIALAFILTGSRAAGPMVLGAGLLGVLTVLLVELFHQTRRLQEDAAIGVVFPGLFAVGVILISRYASQVDLDLDCVLYGEIAYTPWDTIFLGGQSFGPKALWVTGSVFVANLLFVGFFFKELKISTFDPALAATLGFSPRLLHYLLMGAVSLTVVGSFESVGAILVVAMLVVPPATAYLLTDRFSWMISLAVAFGISSAVGGYWLARSWDCSIAGAMAAVAGLQFLTVFLFSPGHGLLVQVLTRKRLFRRLSGQLLLVHLEEDRLLPISTLEARFQWSHARIHRALDRLIQEGLAARDGDGVRLTASGSLRLVQTGEAELAHRI